MKSNIHEFKKNNLLGVSKKLILPILFLLFSCSSTKIVSTWSEPNKQIKISNLNKVLVIAKFKTETSNRKAEDNMVEYLGEKGIQSYNYLKSNFNKDNIDAIRNKIKNDGFDGVVTMRLIDVEQEKIAQRNDFNRYPNNYRDFNNYFYESQMSYENPDYYVTTKVYTIETNVYSIKANKIIWTALTESTDPKGVEKMTAEIAKVVYNQMVKDSFIN
jgi:uncharacterized protein YqkB